MHSSEVATRAPPYSLTASADISFTPIIGILLTLISSTFAANSWSC